MKFASKFEVAYEIIKKWYNKDEESVTRWKEVAPMFIEMGGYYYG